MIKAQPQGDPAWEWWNGLAAGTVQVRAECDSAFFADLIAHKEVREIYFNTAAAADPNAREEDGFTPLHRAAVWGHAEAIKALLATGADAAAPDEDGQTPFDLIPDDSPLVGTSAYLRLKEAQRD